MASGDHVSQGFINFTPVHSKSFTLRVAIGQSRDRACAASSVSSILFCCGLATSSLPRACAAVSSNSNIRSRYSCRNVSSQLSSVVTCAVAYLLMIFPLLLYWKFITGRWLVNSYQGLSFNWTNPEIINVLFSVRKGLLFWSPLLILGIIGLFFVTRYWKGILLPAVILLLLHTYVVSSWPAWWYGGSFGHRAFTETLPIFAIGYAALLETTREKPMVYRGILIGSCLLMLLSIKSMIQYWNGVIPYDESTIAILVSTFFQLAK